MLIVNHQECTDKLIYHFHVKSRLNRLYYNWRGECKTMLSDDLGEKKNFRERAWIFACGLQCNRKTWSCIFVAGFCFIYKDAARKTEWFFCIPNISKTKQSLAEKLRDIVKHT